ncbi:MAG: hypothetical protein RLY93_20485 [Sumerlaeia bacterium]
MATKETKLIAIQDIEEGADDFTCVEVDADYSLEGHDLAKAGRDGDLWAADTKKKDRSRLIAFYLLGRGIAHRIVLKAELSATVEEDIGGGKMDRLTINRGEVKVVAVP